MKCDIIKHTGGDKQMRRYREIDALLREAFALNLNGDAVGACDKWLQAWEYIKELLEEGVATDIYDLNKKYNWKEFPSNHI